MCEWHGAEKLRLDDEIAAVDQQLARAATRYAQLRTELTSAEDTYGVDTMYYLLKDTCVTANINRCVCRKRDAPSNAYLCLCSLSSTNMDTFSVRNRPTCVDNCKRSSACLCPCALSCTEEYTCSVYYTNQCS